MDTPWIIATIVALLSVMGVCIWWMLHDTRRRKRPEYLLHELREKLIDLEYDHEELQHALTRGGYDEIALHLGQMHEPLKQLRRILREARKDLRDVHTILPPE